MLKDQISDAVRGIYLLHYFITYVLLPDISLSTEAIPIFFLFGIGMML
jgi:hypothetical protein